MGYCWRNVLGPLGTSGSGSSINGSLKSFSLSLLIALPASMDAGTSVIVSSGVGLGLTSDELSLNVVVVLSSIDIVESELTKVVRADGTVFAANFFDASRERSLLSSSSSSSSGALRFCPATTLSLVARLGSDFPAIDVDGPGLFKGESSSDSSSSSSSLCFVGTVFVEDGFVL